MTAYFSTNPFFFQQKPLKMFKAALIRVSMLTEQITQCNVKGVTCTDKPTENYAF